MALESNYCNIDGKKIENIPIHLPYCSYCLCSDHLFQDVVKDNCIFYEHFLLGKSYIDCEHCESIQTSSKTVKCLVCENHEFSLKDCLLIPRNKNKIKELILNKKNENLIQILKDQESIRTDAKSFVYDLYKNIINKIYLRREILKKEIETKIDKYYQELIDTIKADQEKTLKEMLNNFNSLDIDELKQMALDVKDKLASENKIQIKNKLIEENIKKCEDFFDKFKDFNKISTKIQNYELNVNNDKFDVENLFGKLDQKELQDDVKISEKIKGNCLKSLETNSQIWCLEILNDREIITGLDDHTIKIWNKDTGDCIQTFKGHTSCVFCLVSLDNNKIVSGSFDKTIKIWNKNNGECIKTVQAHDDQVWCIKIFDNKIISASDDKTIKIWDNNLDNCLKTLQNHTGGVLSLDILENNELISGSRDKTIKLWNIETSDCIRTMQGHTDEVWCIKGVNSNEIISGSLDTTIKIWNKNTGNCLKTFLGHTGRVRSLIVKNTEIVSAGNEIKIWEKHNGECKKTIQGHNNEIWGLEIFKNQEITSGSWDGTIKIWI